MADSASTTPVAVTDGATSTTLASAPAASVAVGAGAGEDEAKDTTRASSTTGTKKEEEEAEPGYANDPRDLMFQDGGESLTVALHAAALYLGGMGVDVPSDGIVDVTGKSKEAKAAVEAKSDGASGTEAGGEGTAAEAVQPAPTGPVTLELFNLFYNAMFRLTVDADTDSPTQYALRVSHSNAYGRTMVNCRSELAWLAALHNATATTGVIVPRPIATAGGEYVVEVKDGEAGSTRHRMCAMTEWLPGKLFYGHVTPDLTRQLGTIMARMHEHVLTWEKPAWFEMQQVEVLMCGPPYQEAEGEVVDAPAHTSPLRVEVAPDVADVYRRCYATVLGTFKALRAAGPEYCNCIHADLHFGNLIVRDDRVLQVIDFDDCGIGPFVQDLGISLFYYWFKGAFFAGVHNPDCDALRNALLEGYESVRPLPIPAGMNRDVVLGDVIAARELQVVSFLAHTDLEQLKAVRDTYLVAAKDRLLAWMKRRDELLAAEAEAAAR